MCRNNRGGVYANYRIASPNTPVAVSAYSRFAISVTENIGLTWYVAGPSVHIVDLYALADPLLARLPALKNSRIGHFQRDILKVTSSRNSSSRRSTISRGHRSAKLLAN
jgi:hypothetical protein